MGDVRFNKWVSVVIIVFVSAIFLVDNGSLVALDRLMFPLASSIAINDSSTVMTSVSRSHRRSEGHFHLPLFPGFVRGVKAAGHPTGFNPPGVSERVSPEPAKSPDQHPAGTSA